MRPFHPKYFKQKTSKRCEYNFTKGSRRGQLCNTIVNNVNFCSKHINIKNNNINVIRVKHHPTLNIIYDPKTKLVFKSDVDKLVVGSIVNDQFSDTYDASLCEKYGLRHCNDSRDKYFLEDLMEHGIPDLDFNEQEFYDGLKEYFF